MPSPVNRRGGEEFDDGLLAKAALAQIGINEQRRLVGAAGHLYWGEAVRMTMRPL
jgi:hypothetical protein